MAQPLASDKLKEAQQGLESPGVAIGGESGVVGGGAPAPGAVQNASAPQGGANRFANITEYLKGAGQQSQIRNAAPIKQIGAQLGSEAEKIKADVSGRQSALKQAQETAAKGQDAASKLMKEYAVNGMSFGNNPQTGAQWDAINNWLTVPGGNTQQVSASQSLLDQAKDIGQNYQDIIAKSQAASQPGFYSSGERALDRALSVNSPVVQQSVIDANAKYNQLTDLINNANNSQIPALAQAYGALPTAQNDFNYRALEKYARDGGGRDAESTVAPKKFVAQANPNGPWYV